MIAELLEDDETALATIDVARYEVANVAVCGWRAPETVGPLLTAIDRLGDDGGVLVSTGALLTRPGRSPRRTRSPYDAAYVAAANDVGLRLVSCDERDLVSKGLAVLPALARD